MNIRDLEYLVALDEFKHFRKAAENCFVSQPTLSGQIKKLEEYLGVLLVERSKHKVLLTEAGKAIVGKARIILAEAAAIEELANIAKDPMRGKISIGIIPTIAPFLLPLIISPLKKKYPELEPFLYEIQTWEILKKLNTGEIDLGILALPVGDSNFSEIELYRETFYMAVSVENSLSLKGSVSLNDLQNETVLLLEDGHCLASQALEICYMAGVKKMSNFKATSMETLRHMLLIENGVTLLPELAVKHYKKLKENYLKYIPFDKPEPERKVGLVYRKTAVRVKCFKNIGQLIIKII